MSNKDVRKGNFTFAILNFYTMMLLCAIATGICTGASMEEGTMTSSIYEEPESKSQDSASDNELNQLASIDETIRDKNSGELLESFKNDNKNLENEKFDNNLLEEDEKESSSRTRNLVAKEKRKRPQSEEEKEEDNCVPQNKTDKRKTINISATTSTVTKISIIMDGDEDDDDYEDDDACTPEIVPFTTEATTEKFSGFTETTTKKCSVCTSKNKDECNKENGDENSNNDNFEQVPTRYACTVTTEETTPGENNNNDTNDISMENQEDLNNDEDNNFEPVPTKPTFLSSTLRLRQKRNYYKNHNNYKNQLLRDNPIYSKNQSKQVMTKEEKIKKIQALLHDIKQKLEVHGNRLNGEMNELRIVKEKMEDFEKNKYGKCENDEEIDDDLIEKLRKALIRQYKAENNYASNDECETENFEKERLVFDVQGKDEEDNFENIHEKNGLNNLEYVDDKPKENLGKLNVVGLTTFLGNNGMWRDRSNLQQGNRWRNTDGGADYQNKYDDGRSGRIFELNRSDMNIQRSIINLDEKQDKSNLVEVNSENLKRSVNTSQEAESNVVEDKSNEINNNIAEQENSSPVYISQIYLIDNNGTNSKII